MKNNVLVIGAGPAGCVTALMLANQGFKVTVLEKHISLLKYDLPTDRSINISLTDRGMNALDTINMGDTVRQTAVTTADRIVHTSAGCSVIQYGNNGEFMYTMGRHDLNKLLLDKIESHSNIEVYYERDLLYVDFVRREAQCNTPTGTQYYKFDVMIGGDGTNSIVRTEINKHRDLGIQKNRIEKGYREFAVPESSDGKPMLNRNAINLWPCNDHIAAILPNANKNTFNGLLFMPESGSPGLTQLSEMSEEDISSWFKNSMPTLYECLSSDFVSKFVDTPNGKLGTIKCKRWAYKDIATILGDAAHTTVPFHAQGTNAAFEDCTVLNDLVKKYNDWGTVFSELENNQAKNGNAMIDLSLEHYKTLSNPGISATDNIRRKVESLFEELYPEIFESTYKLVSFTTMSYDDILRQLRIKTPIIEKLTTKIFREGTNAAIVARSSLIDEGLLNIA